MTFRKLFGLAAIGGILYAHKRHGGEFTIESFKQSWNDLIEGAKMRAMDARTAAETKLHDAATRVADATETAADKDVTGYGSSGFGYDRGDRDLRR